MAADAEPQVCGNHAHLGMWSGHGLKLSRSADGRYRGSARFKEGEILEFKLTLGSWESVEKGAHGEEIANRTHVVRGDTEVELAIARWAGAPATRRSTLTGDIRFHTDFESKQLGNRRTVAVFLPPGYAADESRRFPVLYMHDGQNLFDAATSFLGIEWAADETATRLIEQKKIPPIIIVGLYNTPDRRAEYGPMRADGPNGRGERYMRFVVEEVKPFIDRTYRTQPGRDATAVGGSSLGGLISLHLCARYPAVFSRCAVISPALFWDDRRIIIDVEARPAWLRDLRIWLDMGTREGATLATFSTAIADTRRLASAFESAGLVRDRDFAYLEAEGAVHNEGPWAERFDRVLTFLYDKP